MDDGDHRGWEYHDQEKVEEARQKIQQLLDELRHTISPAQAEDENVAELDEYFASAWILVIGWVGMEDGITLTSMIGSDKYHGPVQKGLLHTALHDLG